MSVRTDDRIMIVVCTLARTLSNVHTHPGDRQSCAAHCQQLVLIDSHPNIVHAADRHLGGRRTGPPASAVSATTPGRKTTYAQAKSAQNITLQTPQRCAPHALPPTPARLPSTAPMCAQQPAWQAAAHCCSGAARPVLSHAQQWGLQCCKPTSAPDCRAAARPGTEQAAEKSTGA